MPSRATHGRSSSEPFPARLFQIGCSRIMDCYYMPCFLSVSRHLFLPPWEFHAALPTLARLVCPPHPTPQTPSLGFTLSALRSAVALFCLGAVVARRTQHEPVLLDKRSSLSALRLGAWQERGA